MEITATVFDLQFVSKTYLLLQIYMCAYIHIYVYIYICAYICVCVSGVENSRLISVSFLEGHLDVKFFMSRCKQ